MDSIRRNVRQAKLRLALNSCIDAWGWCLVGAAGVWVLLVVLARLLDLNWPLGTIAVGLAAASAVAAIGWGVFHRKNDVEAAAILDRAAALKERTSSGLYCMGLDDPFAQATLADAEALSERIRVPSFIRLAWPSSLSFASVAVVLALGIALLPIKPLRADQKLADDWRTEGGLTRTEVRKVKRRINTLRDNADKNPLLRDLKTPLKTLEELPEERLPEHQSKRRELIKQLDSMADALKQKQKGTQFDKMRELKKMFRGLKANKQPQTPTEKLSQALAKGDFRSAQQALKDMKEQLAKLAEKQDPQQQEQLKKQLDNLAKKLAEASRQQQRKQELQQEMQQAGLDPETAKKMLENLTKLDMQQAMKQMQKKGMSQDQAKQMAKKMQACQKAAQDGSGLAEAMQQAAQAMSASTSDAAAQLDELADQLNAMEMLEQQLGELDSTLADLQDMKDDLANQGDDGDCPGCGGEGCNRCGGSGKQGRGGMGRLGQGRGGRAPEEVTGIRFKKERTPVHTGKGVMIAKMFVDGEQVKGDVGTEAVELISAAERDATDALNQNKVPRLYSESVKQYFSDIATEFTRGSADTEGGSEDEQAAAEEDGPQPK